MGKNPMYTPRIMADVVIHDMGVEIERYFQDQFGEIQKHVEEALRDAMSEDSMMDKVRRAVDEEVRHKVRHMSKEAVSESISTDQFKLKVYDAMMDHLRERINEIHDRSAGL